MQKAVFPRAEPVVFDGLAGLFTPVPDGCDRRGLAVLFLSPWGMEELCTRRYYRILAEDFAARGIASLRFDLPGTANALDAPPQDAGLKGWRAAVQSAAGELRALAGTDNIVLLGHGLGGSLAILEAPALSGLAGLILMAPVIRGRGYLRELSLMAKFIDNEMEVKETLRDTAPGSIAGMRMPAEIAAEVKDLNVEKAELPDGKLPVLMVARSPDIEGGLAAALEAAGNAVETVPYEGYEHAVNSPLTQRIPAGLGDRILAWLERLAPSALPPERAGRPPQSIFLDGGAFHETPVRFGADHDFYGTLCAPAGPGAGVAVLILTTGYDPQSGWARSAVELARRLAAAGVASLRFDSAGVGDTAPIAGRRRQILYDPMQGRDVAVAFDFLRATGLARKYMVMGRCSGAFVAFRAAVADARWDGCVVVNPPSFRWRFVGLPRRLSAYGQRLKSAGIVSSLLAGDIHVSAALRNIAVRLLDRAAAILGKAVPPAIRIAHGTPGIHADFRRLAGRGTKVAVVYSQGDEGEDDFRIHFGPDGAGLAGFANVSLHALADADHNVTPRAARDRMFELVEQQALALAP